MSSRDLFRFKIISAIGSFRYPLTVRWVNCRTKHYCFECKRPIYPSMYVPSIRLFIDTSYTSIHFCRQECLDHFLSFCKPIPIVIKKKSLEQIDQEQNKSKSIQTSLTVSMEKNGTISS